MNCREFTEFLHQYLFDDLPVEERAEFEKHLAECPWCVAYLDSYKKTILLTRNAFDANGNGKLLPTRRGAGPGHSPRQASPFMTSQVRPASLSHPFSNSLSPPLARGVQKTGAASCGSMRLARAALGCTLARGP